MSDESSLAVFDLNSQAGIRSVLFAIRQSELSISEKNELKDLVLLYTSGGADESAKISLEKKLNSYGLKPTETKIQKPKEIKPTKPRLSFGSSRPLPSFSVPAVQYTETNKKTNKDISNGDLLKKEGVVGDGIVAKENISSQSVNLQPKQNSRQNFSANEVNKNADFSNKNSYGVEEHEINPEKKAESKLVNNTQHQKPLSGNFVSINRNQPNLVSVSKPGFPPVADKKETNEPPLPNSVAGEGETSVNSTLAEEKKDKQQPTQSIATSPITTKYLNRIREIKSAVNKKVGNPVNLVDIDNQIGREYMNALLEAMKHIGSGGLESDKAMERLEKTYLAVEKAISEKSQADDVVETNSRFEKMQSKTSGFEDLKNTTVPKNELKEVSQNDQLKVNQTKELNQGKLNTVSGFDKNNSVTNDTDSPFRKSYSQMQDKGVPSHNSVTDKVTKTTPYPVRSESPVSVSRQPQVSTPLTKRVTSLAEEVRNLTPEDLPETKNTSADAIGNPLYAPEVDAGLEQLLSDWPLFKKSGLFGTGPKGADHPLFKKIANLQIPVLLAGRFEGANQEIRQSITDYMNGWRYEQGIIYQQGETFEIYLRRVIRHILDAQKQRQPA